MFSCLQGSILSDTTGLQMFLSFPSADSERSPWAALLFNVHWFILLLLLFSNIKSPETKVVVLLQSHSVRWLKEEWRVIPVTSPSQFGGNILHWSHASCSQREAAATITRIMQRIREQFLVPGSDRALLSSGSRACRLKKKAQHEANKIKLWGLNQEYGE